MAFIAGLGVYLPARHQTASEIAAASGLPEPVVRDKLGLSRKTLPGPDDHTNAMGVRAARAALADSGVAPEKVDVLISITEEHKEYPVWTAGIRAAYELGATRAYAYDLGQKCGTGILALKQAADLLRADPQVNTVLIAGGYRNSDLVSYADPNVRFLYTPAAGGGAAVVTRSSAKLASRGGFEILGSAFRTDGSFSED